MTSSSSPSRRSARPAAGMTLVEVLVTMALLSMIIAMVFPVVTAVMNEQRTLHQQTDRYESLRLPASIIVQDIRRATGCRLAYHDLNLDGGSYPVISLQLNKSDGRMVEYIFATAVDGDATLATPDMADLHRWEGPKDAYGYTIPEVDEIVGLDLVPANPDPWAEPQGTTYSCTTDYYSGQLHAFINLVAYADAARTKTTSLYVYGYMRQR